MRSLILVPAAGLFFATIAFAPEGEAEAKTCKVDAASAAAGKRVYLRCQACHALEVGGARKIGPSLVDMFSGKPLPDTGFKYSAAFEKAKPVWTDAKLLDQFLAKPSAAIPGNKMVFAGLSKPEDRANVVAYMKSVTGC